MSSANSCLKSYPPLSVQEVHALAAVGSHPHIVRYHTAWIEKEAGVDGEHLYIQLEACDTSVGNLRALKTQSKESELVEMLRQVGTLLLTQAACSLCIAHRCVSLHA